jgi:hypothetical protein
MGIRDQREVERAGVQHLPKLEGTLITTRPITRNRHVLIRPVWETPDGTPIALTVASDAHI